VFPLLLNSQFSPLAGIAPAFDRGCNQKYMLGPDTRIDL